MAESKTLTMLNANLFRKPYQAFAGTPLTRHDKSATSPQIPLRYCLRGGYKRSILGLMRGLQTQTFFMQQHQRLDKSWWACAFPCNQIRWVNHYCFFSSFMNRLVGKIFHSFKEQNRPKSLSFFPHNATLDRVKKSFSDITSARLHFAKDRLFSL